MPGSRSQSPADEGVRRRHSLPRHNEDYENREDERAAAQSLDLSRRNIGDEDGIRSSGNDLPSSPRRGSEGASHRVRFSLDTERRSKNKKRKSDEIVEENGGSDRERPRSRGLKVDTGAAQAAASNARGQIRSPDNMLSPPSGSSPRSASPRTRHRGMSLRSSLFTRNMRQQSPAGEGSVIELQDVGSSNGGERRPDTAKSKSRPSVTISPVPKREYSPPEDALAQVTAKKAMQGSFALPNYQQWMSERAERHLPLKRMHDAMEHMRKFILRIQEIPPSKDGRHVPLDPSRKKDLLDDRTSRPFVGNTIKSSKYNVWNFLPRQLFAQFSKLANFYFLCVSILQMIPGLSTTGTYTTIVPLLIFVSIAMAKEGYEDFRRFKLDKEENDRETNVLHAYRPIHIADGDIEAGEQEDGPLHWASTKWHNLHVGDVVKIQRDEAIPADMVLLSSEGVNNIAYIETMALDGETNLKNKSPPTVTSKTCSTPEGIAATSAEFVVEDPNLDLYNFEGKVTIGDETAPLTNNEIVYRGSVLRNTPSAIGMVIYSGEECKIRMNANKNPRIKAPALQSTVNKIVILIVIFVVALAVFNSVAYELWRGFENKAWYLTSDARVAFGPIITSFIIMFNTMIPLSLYVSLEIVKVAQMFLLNDVDMYDEASNTPFEARTSTINEELGQVGYVFSDKTGTLTENVMRFRKLSVAGTAWLHDFDLKGKGEADDGILMHKKRRPKGKGKKPARLSRVSHDVSRPSMAMSAAPRDDESDAPRKSTSQCTSATRPGLAQVEQNTRDLVSYLQRRPDTIFARKAKMLVLSMALCHTCLPERSEDGEMSFQASSPDELALVRAAQELGYLAYERNAAQLTVRTYAHGVTGEPIEEVYEVLDVIEFSSKRKRMSVVLRFPDGRICVMTKGADSVVMQRLRLAALANQKVNEIEKRVTQRKSMEAHQAMLRKSMQIERSGSVASSFPKTSLTLASPRLPRTSMGRMGTVRDVDSWLRDRERDVDVEPVSAGHSVYYSPRPSAQLARTSLAVSEHRNSGQSPMGQIADDDDDDEFVEEALVIDDAAVIERCFQHINDFASEGLRTLLYGHRFLDEKEYRGWKKIYNDATTSLVNRQELIEKAGEMIEQQLELGGATAIEDKLQNGVPETIERLRRANIRMWMLTGDKRETAINIGHSCRLIKDYSSVSVLDAEAGDVEQNIAATILDLQRGSVAHSVVVIDGQTLAYITTDDALNTLFLDLAILADSVICCRASPSQKASLVHAIRRRVSRSVTLAIGDGANDIAMIQEAHVGIGITGKEGLQAARTSDYSIAQFRFLVKLLLVHGRWNYVRTCKYTVGTFWKEMLFYLTQALYQRWAGYTGTSLYESWSLSMFNTLFTSLPVIFLGIFEKDLLPATLIAVPELYTKGQRGAGFNLKVYLGWMFMAAAEAMIIYFTMFGLFGKVDFTLDNGLFAMGDLTFTACIIVIVTKLQVLEIHNHSVTAVISFVLSVGGWFLWNIILAGVYKDNSTYNVKDGFFNRFGRNALWWLTLILATSSCLLFEITFRSLKAAYVPTDVETFQALEQDLEVRKRFEESSAAWLQAGWHHGTKKSSLELQREEDLQAKREGEITELLSRPRVMEEGGAGNKGGVQTEEVAVYVDDGPGRGSVELREMLGRRFGNVKRETLGARD